MTSKIHRQATRLEELPPYIFSEINAIKAAATKKGIQLLSLGIGDPDLPTPTAIIEKLKQAADKPSNHVYSPYEGTLEFRQSVATWFAARFGTKLNPETEVMALIGSKEGIAHFPMAFVNPGDKCLYPSPGYPIFQTAIQLAGGIPIPLPLRPELGFLPDLNELETMLLVHQPKYLLINFPSNPTSATCPRETMEGIVRLAQKTGTILVSDNAYSEIYYEAKDKPVSVLEIPGAKDIAIEFHSFSKTFNMTGWRIAFAAGNASLIAGLTRIKTNIDSGPLLAVQETASFALTRSAEFCDPIREVYRQRRAVLLQGLKAIGIEYFEPKATFFVWAKVPGGRDSMTFTKELIEKAGLVVTPGIGFGKEGDAFFRLALTVPVPAIEDAIERLRKF